MSAPAGPYIVRVKPKHEPACETRSFVHHAPTGGDHYCICRAGNGSRWA
jgi:hypothetical protein